MSDGTSNGGEFTASLPASSAFKGTSEPHGLLPSGSALADSGISDCWSNDVILNEIHRNLPL